MSKKRSLIVFRKPSKTVKSQGYEADINNMVKGLTPFTQSRRQPFYVDETIFPATYEQHFNQVLAAQDAFMSLPPDVREHFQNDPASLSAALADPKRQGELRDLGVLPPLDLDNPPAQPREKAEERPSPKDGEEGGTK